MATKQQSQFGTMTGTTTIEVTREQADQLYQLKGRTEAYRNVVNSLLAMHPDAEPDPDVDSSVFAGDVDQADAGDVEAADQDAGGGDLADQAETATQRVRDQLPDE